MKTVVLHGAKAAGRVALVDDTDYDLVVQYRWHVDEQVMPWGSLRGPYAAASTWINGRNGVVRMHKLITGFARTDHRNHNGLDNQRSNLRDATHAENQRNQSRRPGCVSGFKQVAPGYRTGTWTAQITVDGKRRYLGTYEDVESAARAYDTAARHYFGEYACPNFPD
jgi:hypothetical protein